MKAYQDPSIDEVANDFKKTGRAVDADTYRWSTEVGDLLLQSFTDTGNAERFVLRREDMRYCHTFKAWFIWDGRRWARDQVDQARTLGKDVIIEFLKQAAAAKNEPAEKFARISLDSRRITNMLFEAQAALAIRPEEFDQDPDLLSFANGTLNLKTGEFGPHDPRHFISKLVKFNYQPEATCPLFLATMDRLMGGGPHATEAELERADRLVSALQVYFGYALTGHVSEKAVFILLGPGNNGKTMILGLFFKLLEEHATVIQIDSLMARQENSNSQADLADLRGARFAMTSETEEGQRLSEAKLKRITQGAGSMVKAVRKYENPFSFPETHKLFMDANHKPIIRGTGDATWNRLFPIPFSVTIPPEEIDRNLQAKLLKEAEGILARAVAGARRWYRDGLGEVQEVREAVNSYREEMDQVGRFLRERCTIGAGLEYYMAALYPAYRQWAEAGGEYAISMRAFGDKLREHKNENGNANCITSEHTRHGALYHGLYLGIDDSKE